MKIIKTQVIKKKTCDLLCLISTWCGYHVIIMDMEEYIDLESKFDLVFSERDEDYEKDLMGVAHSLRQCSDYESKMFKVFNDPKYGDISVVYNHKSEMDATTITFSKEDIENGCHLELAGFLEESVGLLNENP